MANHWWSNLGQPEGMDSLNRILKMRTEQVKRIKEAKYKTCPQCGAESWIQKFLTERFSLLRSPRVYKTDPCSALPWMYHNTFGCYSLFGECDALNSNRELIKAIKELKAERRSLPSSLQRLEAERDLWFNKSRELNKKRLSLFDESRELNTKRLFLFDESRELNTKLEVAERKLHVLKGVRGHVDGRLVALDKEIRRTQESPDDLDTVISELQVMLKDLDEKNLKSELRNRIKLIRLIKLVICLLYALLNRSGRQRHGSQCNLGTVLILLFRSGVEANPGPGPPRNWKDLPTTVRHLGILSSQIANGWEYYADRLGLTEDDRDVIVAKYPRTQMQIYHMLKLAALLRPNMTMRTMLIILEECTEEFDDMVVAWEKLEDFFADEEEEILIAVQANERDGEGENASSSRGLKRISNFELGESSVKIQRK
ncbi:uncharacterized protein LOC128221325 isoform X3 [Mya arenaria]|nr:uncharacterized protein LOC128221325 isoform X3 [Mya arenaria]XP_052785839.1 uncharacterized protein LOC128221325 isoform X3 [Mya arenaria]XP_052785841.1 uncharacterized protein LOC128221325 isoform X3 [Mya arenaria]